MQLQGVRTTADHASESAFRYWRQFGRMLAGGNPLASLDVPLMAASAASRQAAGWSGTLLTLSGISTWGLPWISFFHHTLTIRQPVFEWILRMAWAVLWCSVAAVLLYGLGRLYTLVLHVMVTTMLKVRGQRLRLLNLHTALMPALVPVSLGVAVIRVAPWAAILLFIATAAYGSFWLGRGYNFVFHARGWRGLSLFAAGTAMTIFILAIGAIALAVSGGVLLLIAAAVARGFFPRG